MLQLQLHILPVVCAEFLSTAERRDAGDAAAAVTSTLYNIRGKDGGGRGGEWRGA